MFDYRLSFDIEVKSSDYGDEVEVLIISRRDVAVWKNDGSDESSSTQNIQMHYSKNGHKINDVFKPSISDAYAFILSNRSCTHNTHNNKKFKTKTVEVILTHSWQQEIKESHLKNRM